MSGELKCPGQDSRFLKAGDIVEATCPDCGHTMEFWPDELMRTCRGCGSRITNPASNMKCLEWCKHAAECLEAIRGAEGTDVGPLRDEIFDRAKRVLGDVKLTEHTLAVLELTEQIGRRVGANPLVIIPAAILHDVGRASPRRSGALPWRSRAAPQTGGECPEGGPDGRQMAAEVLADIDLPGAIRDEILDLVQHHHERDKMGSENGSALFDADLIVNLRRKADWQSALARKAITEEGRRIGADYLARVAQTHDNMMKG